MSWPEENGFTLLSPYGETLANYAIGYFETTTSGTEIFTFTSDCTPPACLIPTNLTATGLTTTSANLGWTENGSATQWIVEYGLFGFTPGTGTNVNASSNPLTVSGLNPATSYAFYVRANCGGGNGMSSWAGSFAFATECDIVSTLNEDFEAAVPPICWSTFANGAGTQVWETSTDYSNSGVQSAVAMYESSTGENQKWLVTGQINLPANHKLTFYIKDDFTTDYLSILNVMISTDANPNNTAAYTQLLQLAETDVTNEDFTQFEIDLSAYASQTVYIAVVMIDDDGDAWYLDDVKLEQNVSINNTVVSTINIYPNPSNGMVTITNAEG